jgi:hypothetical protein
MSEVSIATELTDEYGFVLPVRLEIEFDHTPYERPSRDFPGSQERIDITDASVWYGPLNLGPHPYPKSLEHLVWEQREKERVDAAENIAERRAA